MTVGKPLPHDFSILFSARKGGFPTFLSAGKGRLPGSPTRIVDKVGKKKEANVGFSDSFQKNAGIYAGKPLEQLAIFPVKQKKKC